MISVRTLQEFMKTSGSYYAGVVDGVAGPMSYSAARALLKANNIAASLWDNARTWVGLTQLFLNKVTDAGLIVDGDAGQKTNDALYAYTSSLLNAVQHTWPRQRDVRAGTSMFGSPGRNQGSVHCPYTMFGDYDRKIKVNQFSAHTKVVPSLERILQRTLDHYGATAIRKLNLDIFSGCYNYRSTTGSSSLSLHSWGVAIDIDAAHNQMDEANGEAAFAKPVYAPFLDFFEAEGWTSLGRARNFDYMHLQAPRL